MASKPTPPFRTKYTQAHAVTRLGRPVHIFEWRTTSSANSLRVVWEHTSDDRGQGQAKVCRGDGRTPKFELIHQLDNPTEEQVRDLVRKHVDPTI